MISLRDATNISAQVQALYTSSFPSEERRNITAQQELLQNGALRLSHVEKDGVFAGFVFYWTLTDFTFIEHFAIDNSQRGGGIGSAVIGLFPGAIVLEVEPPLTPGAIRRIHFYERLGFKAWEHAYLQPAYHAGGAPLKMLLMQKGMSPEEHTFNIVSNEIYREVYGV
jgi:ribosomal protein S18 acetylase RimI-like enzyme